jgi:hypothetical protein
MALGGQRLKQRGARIGRPADLPAVLCRLIQTAPRQILARRGRPAGAQLQAEKLDPVFHHGRKLAAAVGFLGGLRVAGGHWHPGLARQQFHRLHETEVLGLLHKGQGVAFGVAAKTVIKPFAIIDMEACRFLLMKRARRPHITLALIGFAHIPRDLAPNDMGQRGSGAQIIKESGWEAHALYIGRPPGRGKRAIARRLTHPAIAGSHGQRRQRRGRSDHQGNHNPGCAAPDAPSPPPENTWPPWCRAKR